ncbi:hypothetical protein GIB67_005183 [Kingdonia uniflora]|uniref:Uncharacterized protein n=1 Tax=Kingdonia uniflora TaxID=39325 RepID=A0A7J7NMX2_9MAGN|nr:hypothetical protein GIB67_005183 [Kingdonia uniflora]
MLPKGHRKPQLGAWSTLAKLQLRLYAEFKMGAFRKKIIFLQGLKPLTSSLNSLKIV